MCSVHAVYPDSRGTTRHIPRLSITIARDCDECTSLTLKRVHCLWLTSTTEGLRNMPRLLNSLVHDPRLVLVGDIKRYQTSPGHLSNWRAWKDITPMGDIKQDQTSPEHLSNWRAWKDITPMGYPSSCGRLSLFFHRCDQPRVIARLQDGGHLCYQYRPRWKDGELTIQTSGMWILMITSFQ